MPSRYNLDMAKAQHKLNYRILPDFLRQMRAETGLTQRGLGAIIDRPQSWIQNCEKGDRRIDITEFILWARACKVNPRTAFSQLLKEME